MALQLSPKAATGVVRYGWNVPILVGDAVSSATLVIASGTISIDSYGIDGPSVFFFASGGAEGETAVIEAEAVTSQGETLTETLYLPVRTTDLTLGQSVGDVLAYALRPIVGIGRVATAAELEDARENLDDMLTSWALRGANLGVKLPTDVSDILYIPDGYMSAVKANLRVRLCELYGKPVTSVDALNARTGFILITHSNLPEERASVYY